VHLVDPCMELSAVLVSGGLQDGHVSYYERLLPKVV
jgi:hypothetical protein